jgi:hypothetical protein
VTLVWCGDITVSAAVVTLPCCALVWCGVVLCCALLWCVDNGVPARCSLQEGFVEYLVERLANADGAMRARTLLVHSLLTHTGVTLE